MIRNFVVVSVLALATHAFAADGQTPFRLRGAITGLEGNVLSVKTREGQEVKLNLADNVTVATAKAVKLTELKSGERVGATTRVRPDGTHVALEVHTLAPTTGLGQMPWDLEPETTMTNGFVGTVSTAGTQEIVLDYQKGAQKIIVPPNAPVVTFVPGTRADLKPGEYIFTLVQPSADGRLNVQRVSVGKDGVRPPQ